MTQKLKLNGWITVTSINHAVGQVWVQVSQITSVSQRVHRTGSSSDIKAEIFTTGDGETGTLVTESLDDVMRLIAAVQVAP